MKNSRTARRDYHFLTTFDIEAVVYKVAPRPSPRLPRSHALLCPLLHPDGKGRIESALAEPQQTFDGRFLHRTIFDKTAALFRSIIKNHPLTAATVFLMDMVRVRGRRKVTLHALLAVIAMQAKALATGCRASVRKVA